MEQSDTGKAHNHIILIGCLYHIIIPDGTAGLCYIFYSALMRSFNIISEREECIGTERNILHTIQPCSLGFAGEYLRANLECSLPYIIADHIHVFLADIEIYRIISVCPAYAVYELKSQYLRRLS